jgi:hypothetical protein
MKVTHYVCPSDIVPRCDFKNKRACEDTIRYIQRMPNCKQSCHEFSNPIYLPYLEREIQDYQRLLKNYAH